MGCPSRGPGFVHFVWTLDVPREDEAQTSKRNQSVF